MTAVWAKVAFVAIYIVAATVGTFLAALHGVSPLSVFIVRLGVDTAVLALGVRTFRAAGEPVIPERPWWKATGRPLAGFVIAALWIVQILVSLPSAFSDPEPASIVTSVVGGLVSLAYSAFFLNSTLRLRKQPAGKQWWSRTRSPDF